MRLAWAVIAGAVLGTGLAWWLSRDTPRQAEAKRARAEQAAAVQARDAVPSLYRWRDDAGVLQITDEPPRGRAFERIDRDSPLESEVRGR